MKTPTGLRCRADDPHADRRPQAPSREITMPYRLRTVEDITAQILADIDHQAQLMLAGAMPPMPVRSLDPIADEVPATPLP